MHIQVARLQQQRFEFVASYTALLKEAANLSSPATFAQSAKLQRTAIFQEKEAQKLEAQQVILPTVARLVIHPVTWPSACFRLLCEATG